MNICNPPTLDQLATKWGTDKASKHHGYCDDYDVLFTPLRNEPIVLLELGWGEGRSAGMWREYFPKGVIIILDNFWPIARIDGVHKYLGDQADPKVLDEMVATHGDFDIVIDDASHIEEKTLASYALLWPHVKPGGFYVVEDTNAYRTIPVWQDITPDALAGPNVEVVLNRGDVLAGAQS